MVVAFLDKISGFVDRRFMIAFWAPVFLFATSGVFVLLASRGDISNLISWWGREDASSQALLVLGFLLSVTVGAYVLQAFASPLIYIYEGYWPAWMLFLIQWSQYSMERALRSFRTQTKRARGEAGGEPVEEPRAEDQVERQVAFSRYVRFPVKASRLRPTRLGNALTAAEEYAYEIYGIDTVLWWPRLIPLLPDLLRAQIDAALTPLLALLNLSTLLILLAGVVSAAGLIELNFFFFVVGSLACLTLARICYTAAVMQASDYGQQVRVAFDLYRSEILRQMRLPIPSSQPEETALWYSLNRWIYNYEPPSETGWPPDLKDLEGGFQYAAGKSDRPQPLQVDVTLRRDLPQGARQ